MPRSQTIANALNAKLRSDQSSGSFYDDLGGRIYESEAQHDDSLPLCVWQVITNEALHLLANSDDLKLRLQISVLTKRVDGSHTCRNAHDKLVSLLNRKTLIADGWSAVSVLLSDGGAPQINEDAYTQLSNWQIIASA